MKPKKRPRKRSKRKRQRRRRNQPRNMRKNKRNKKKKRNLRRSLNFLRSKRKRDILRKFRILPINLLLMRRWTRKPPSKKPKKDYIKTRKIQPKKPHLMLKRIMMGMLIPKSKEWEEK